MIPTSLSVVGKNIQLVSCFLQYKLLKNLTSLSYCELGIANKAEKAINENTEE